MQWLAVGDARIQVLGGMMHDPKAAAKAAETIRQLRPAVVMVDRSLAEWESIGRLDALQQLILGRVPGPWQADVLWKQTADAARHVGAEIVLLHRELPVVPKKGMKQLQKMLKKEGFDASGDPARDLTVLYRHYILRTPLLWQHLEHRRDRAAARLRAALEARPSNAMVVLAQPDVEEISDRVRALGEPSLS